MALTNLAAWSQKAAGVLTNSACGSACGSGDKVLPTACGAGDK